MAGTTQNLSRIDRLRCSKRVIFGSVFYNPRSSFGPREQLDFQLVLLHEGEAVITVDDGQFLLPARYVALLKPGRRERFEFARETRTHHSWCAVAPASVDPALARQLESAPALLPLTTRMAQLIEIGLGGPESGDPVSESGATGGWFDSLGETCLRTYLLEAGSGAKTPVPEPLARAKAALETRFAEPLSVESLAAIASVSPHHLVRLFARHFKTTPARMLWKLRLERGIQMLADTGLTVAEIAYRVGFQNPFHFSRKVKQATGASPREWRKERWKG